MKTKLLTIFLLLIIPKVFGYDANWTLVGKDVNNTDIFLDFETITKNESSNYNTWLLINHSEGYSSLNSYEIDCQHFRTRITYFEAYSKYYAKGKKTIEFTTEDIQKKHPELYKWFYEKPGSYSYDATKKVCSKK